MIIRKKSYVFDPTGIPVDSKLRGWFLIKSIPIQFDKKQESIPLRVQTPIVYTWPDATHYIYSTCFTCLQRLIQFDMLNNKLLKIFYIWFHILMLTDWNNYYISINSERNISNLPSETLQNIWNWYLNMTYQKQRREINMLTASIVAYT